MGNCFSGSAPAEEGAPPVAAKPPPASPPAAPPAALPAADAEADAAGTTAGTSEPVAAEPAVEPAVPPQSGSAAAAAKPKPKPAEAASLSLAEALGAPRVAAVALPAALAVGLSVVRATASGPLGLLAFWAVALAVAAAALGLRRPGPAASAPPILPPDEPPAAELVVAAAEPPPPPPPEPPSGETPPAAAAVAPGAGFEGVWETAEATGVEGLLDRVGRLHKTYPNVLARPVAVARYRGGRKRITAVEGGRGLAFADAELQPTKGVPTPTPPVVYLPGRTLHRTDKVRTKGRGTAPLCRRLKRD